MVDSEQFKTSVFGGFDKQDVIDYIAELMQESETQRAELQQDFENRLQKNEQIIKNYEMRLKQAVVQRQSLREQVREHEENYQRVLMDKNAALDQNAVTIREQQCQIQNLKGQLEHVNDFKEERDRIVQNAQKAAKDKTDQLIQKARQQVEDEYQTRMDEAEEEIRRLHKKAREDASRILQNAAERSRELTSQAQKEADRILESAHRRQEEMIARAEQTAKRSLTQGTAAGGKRVKPDFSGDADFLDFDRIQEEIEREVSAALRHLDSADLSVQTARDKIEEIQVPPYRSSSAGVGTRKYKHALQHLFSQKERE